MAWPWDDGILTRTTIYGVDGLGNVRPVHVNDDGELACSITVGDITVSPASEGVVGDPVPSKATYIAGYGEGTGDLSYLMVDADNNLHVTARTGFPDPGNTRAAAPLLKNVTWTGTWFDAEEYPFVNVAFKSDVASATDGFKIQFGADGINVGCEFAVTYDGALVGVGRGFTVQRRGRYVRLVYTNGNQDAAALTVVCIFQKAGAVGEPIVADKLVDQHDIAILTKSLITGRASQGGGTYVDVKVNPSGTLQVGGGMTPTDAYPNPTDAINVAGLTMAWSTFNNTWERLHVEGTNFDDEDVKNSGVLSTESYLKVFNGTTWDRARGDIAHGLLVDVSRINGTVETAPSAYSQSAFGEVRISKPYVMVDLISKYGRSTVDTSTSLTGGGLVTDVPAMSGFALSVTTANADAARVRTNEWYRYQTGRGQRITLTLLHADAGQTNQVRNWGYFDNSDGLMFRLSGTTLSIVRRTSTGESGGSLGSPYEEVVPKASWNVAPGVACDVTKGNIYEIQFQWLGVGIVKFFINGTLVHQMLHPNALAYPYMRTASLPLTWEIYNTALTTASSFTVICGNVTSENGEDPPLFNYGYQGAAVTTTTAAETPMVSFRLKSAINGIDNRAVVIPMDVDVESQTSTTNVYAVITIRLNGTLTGATWPGTTPAAQSAVEIDTAATAVTGGTVIDRFVVSPASGNGVDLSEHFKRNARKMLRNAYTGVSDIITVSVTRPGGQNTNVTVVPSVDWFEIL